MRIQKKEGETSKDSLLLRSNQTYVVYGISFKASPQFLIYEPDELSFPFFVASEAVEVVDARLCSCWSYSPQLSSTDIYSSRFPLVSFEVMVRDRRFYQSLVDGDPIAVAAWEEAKRLIDSESYE